MDRCCNIVRPIFKEKLTTARDANAYEIERLDVGPRQLTENKSNFYDKKLSLRGGMYVIGQSIRAGGRFKVDGRQINSV